MPLARRLAETRAVERRYESALRSRYGYDLFQRNCVSEIFRTLELALVEGAGAQHLEGRDRANLVRAESRRRLGGYVDPVAGLNFIPRVSSQRVRTRYALVEATHLPSYRHHQMARMAESEGALRVALRESNVLTSTLYEPNGEDGFFLFFTDGGVPLRPLLGALNLVAGLGNLQRSGALLPERPQGHQRMGGRRRASAAGLRSPPRSRGLARRPGLIGTAAPSRHRPGSRLLILETSAGPRRMVRFRPY
jgi:hypothetical protein